jgi:hypothetical protein
VTVFPEAEVYDVDSRRMAGKRFEILGIRNCAGLGGHAIDGHAMDVLPRQRRAGKRIAHADHVASVIVVPHDSLIYLNHMDIGPWQFGCGELGNHACGCSAAAERQDTAAAIGHGLQDCIRDETRG